MGSQKLLKKVLIVLILLTAMAMLSGCGETTTSNPTDEKTITNQLNAEEIINKMKNENPNIGKIVVYTEDTDTNQLLGRPGQYTSKILFEDKRLKQENANNEYLTEEERNEPTGGTIEVFANEKDMESRKKYVENFTSTAMFSQYVYAKGNVLLRVEGKLTPSQAKEYEGLLNKIVK